MSSGIIKEANKLGIKKKYLQECHFSVIFSNSIKIL